MIRRLRRSLRTRIVALVVLALVPGFLLAFAASNEEREQAEANARDRTAALATAAAARWEARIDEASAALRALAEVVEVSGLGEQCEAVVRAIRTRLDGYVDLMAVRPDGSVACTSEPARAGLDLSGRDWFRAARAEPRAVVVGNAYRDETGALALGVAIAVSAPGGTPFVLAAPLDLRALAPVFGGIGTAADTALVLIDRDDRTLYRAGDPEAVGDRIAETDVVRAIRARPDGGTVVARGADGRRRIYAHRTLEVPGGALVVAGVPTSVAYAPANETFRDRMLGLGLAGLVALVVAALFGERSLVLRLRRLGQVTKQAAAGDLSVRSGLASDDEVGELAAALDAMIEELDARDDERIRLLGYAVLAGEEERRRIAGEVHDDTIQVMAAHVMGLQVLRRLVDSPELAHRIDELEASGRAATARLRDLVFELYSPTLDDQGLGAALRVLLQRVFEHEAVRWTVDDRLDEPPLAEARDVAYRCAQEAIRNVRAHAHARRVQVVVRRDGGDLVVEVHDDGRGFDPATMPADRPGHLGLRGAAERAESVGGRVTIESEPRAGTTVTVRIPWALGRRAR